MRLSRSTLLLGLLVLPLFELAGHVWIRAGVPALADYQAAAEFVRSQLQPRDLIRGEPAFIDPIVRWQLGDRMPLAMAGRSDDAGYERAWIVSIRGATRAGTPELERQFGQVRVLRHRLRKSPVLFDFVSAWSEGRASIERAGVAQPCLLRTGGVPRGGGLGKGVLMPVRERFECDQARPWLFVSAVVLEDLENVPHHCIWQHPQGPEPVHMSFRDVPLGAALVFHAGIYYEHERMRKGGPIEATISIAGRTRAQFRHVDGDGYRSLSIDTSELAGTRAEVTVSVRAGDPTARSFCWAASTRGPQP